MRYVAASDPKVSGHHQKQTQVQRMAKLPPALDELCPKKYRSGKYNPDEIDILKNNLTRLFYQDLKLSGPEEALNLITSLCSV